jgi:hypothetical protein
MHRACVRSIDMESSPTEQRRRYENNINNRHEQSFRPESVLYLIFAHLQYMISTVFRTLTLAGCNLDACCQETPLEICLANMALSDSLGHGTPAGPANQTKFICVCLNTYQIRDSPLTFCFLMCSRYTAPCHGRLTTEAS